MNKQSYHISVIFLILIVSQLSRLPTTFKSLRLYERNSGDTIYLVLAKPKHNRGVIYTAQSEADKGLEVFDGEYHIHGKNYQPDPRSEEFMNQTLSLAKNMDLEKPQTRNLRVQALLSIQKGLLLK